MYCPAFPSLRAGELRPRGQSFAVILRCLACGLLLAVQAQAHLCGPSVVRVKVGEVACYRIIADVVESEETAYGVVTPPPVNVATVTPNGPFFSFNYGEIAIYGKAPGTNTVQVNWSYAPNSAFSSCTFVLEVSLPDPVPPTTSEQHQAGTAGDPVNTATGELFFSERPDFSLGGPMPLEFQRYYSSFMTKSGLPNGTVGKNWQHNFELRLRRIEDFADIQFQYGRRIRFQQAVGGGWTLIKPLDTPYQLREAGGLFVLMDPVTQRRYAFDASGRLRSIKDRNDNAHTLTYVRGDTGNVPEKVADGLGRELNLIYVGDQQLAAVTNGNRGVQFFQDFGNLRLLIATDARGKSTSYYYESDPERNGLLTARQRPRGNRPLQQTYDAAMRVATQVNGQNVTVARFRYDAGQTSRTNGLGEVATHFYDATGRLVRSVAQDGATVGIGYTPEGQRGPVTNGVNRTPQFNWHPPSAYPLTVRDELGNTRSNSYTVQVDADGFAYYDLTRVDHPDGSYETFTYDVRGNRLTRRDRSGNTWSWTYNTRGQPLTAHNPLGGGTTNVYNPDGTLASTTDQAGNTTTYTYDTYRRVSRLTRADGTYREWTYDNNDHIVTFRNELGGTTTNTYDDNGNLVDVMDSFGHSTSYAYDNVDRLINRVDRVGGVIASAYDSEDRLASVINNESEQLAYVYDARGNLVRATDARGFTRTNVFDPADRLTTSIDPLGHTTRYEYDDAGRPIHVITPLNRTNKVSYDPMGRVTAVENANRQPQAHTFDGNGWVTKIQLADSTKTEFTLNGLSLLTRLRSANSENWDFTYDTQGRVTAWIDPLGQQTAFAYNSRNWINHVTFPGGLGTLDVTLNGLGAVTRRLYSDGTDLAYAYDTEGRLTGATGVTLTLDNEGRVVECNGLALTRNAANGRVETLTLAPGKTVSYFYNENRQVTSIADWIGGNTVFTYDDAGRLTSMIRPNGVSTTYAYDDDNNVTGIAVSGSLSSIALQYDGDRQIIGAARQYPQGLPFASQGFAQTVGAAEQASGVTYDAMGRVISDGVRTYTWDLASRLASYTEGARTVSFQHNAFGHVTRRTESGQSRDYVWNHAFPFPVVSKEMSGGNDVRYHIHTPGGVLLYTIEAADNARHFHHHDEMGNTVFLTDDAGQVAGVYAYLPFGEMQEAGAPAANLFTFGGKWGVMREGNGLFIMGQRFYDSHRARFLSRDPSYPLIHPLNANPYSFASGNPLRYLDPLGTVPNSPPATTPGDVANTVGNVVNTAGGVQSVTGHHVEQAYETAKAVAKATTEAFNPEEVSHIQGATRALKAEEQLGKINNIVNGKAGKVLGAAGDAVAVVNLAQESWKLKQNMDKTLSNYDHTLASALAAMDLLIRNAWISYRAKHINFFQLQRRIIDAKYLFQMRLLEADMHYDVDFMSSIWTAYGNTLGNFIPGFGLVTPNFEATVR